MQRVAIQTLSLARLLEAGIGECPDGEIDELTGSDRLDEPAKHDRRVVPDLQEARQ